MQFSFNYLNSLPVASLFDSFHRLELCWMSRKNHLVCSEVKTEHNSNSASDTFCSAQQEHGRMFQPLVLNLVSSTLLAPKENLQILAKILELEWFRHSLVCWLGSGVGVKGLLYFIRFIWIQPFASFSDFRFHSCLHWTSLTWSVHPCLVACLIQERKKKSKTVNFFMRDLPSAALLILVDSSLGFGWCLLLP